MTPNHRQMGAWIAVTKAILEALQAIPEGVPAGHLYAHLMGHMSLESFSTVMEALVLSGKVTHSHNVYKAVQ